MVLSRARLFAIAIFLYGFFLSYFFSPLHFGGDAVHYTNAYNSVSNGTSNIFAARLNYLTYLYSYEYVHFLIVWLSSLIGLEKLLVFSLANGFLYFISFRLAYLYGGSIFLALVLVVTNYYLLALFFTLEKLKIAIIFLLLGVYYIKTNSKVFGAILLLVAPLSHLQVIIYYISYLSSQVFNKKFYNFLLLTLALVFISILAFYLQDYIVAKLRWYANMDFSSAIFNTVKVFTFGLFVFFLSGMKGSVAAFYVSLSLMALAIGGADRLFMFAYFYFLFVAFSSGKIGRIFIYASVLFMMYKSLVYIHMVVQFGG